MVPPEASDWLDISRRQIQEDCLVERSIVDNPRTLSDCVLLLGRNEIHQDGKRTCVNGPNRS